MHNVLNRTYEDVCIRMMTYAPDDLVDIVIIAVEVRSLFLVEIRQKPSIDHFATFGTRIPLRCVWMWLVDAKTKHYFHSGTHK